MNIRNKFNRLFFKELHSRLVENLSGQIQVKLSEQDEPNINEYFIQDKVYDILDRRASKIDNSLKIIKNKSHKPFKDKIKNRFNILINPEFDIRIVGSDYKMLYAVYEIKSRLQGNSLNERKVYEDFQRLALVKAIFPETKCIFILPGLFDEMKYDFEKKEIVIPHTFNINNNPNYKKQGSYKSVFIPFDIVNNSYSDALNSIGISKIKIRLSQTSKGKRNILFTYDINVKE